MLLRSHYALIRIIGFLGVPIDFVYKHTIPKCSEIENEKYYALSFFTSIAWIGLISYVLVEVAEKIGCIVGLSDTVMGLTLLASGKTINQRMSTYFNEFGSV